MTTADHTHTWYTVERNRRLWWGCACGAEEALATPDATRALREALAGLVAEGDAITAAPDEYTASLAFDRMDAAIVRARNLLAGEPS